MKNLFKIFVCIAVLTAGSIANASLKIVPGFSTHLNAQNSSRYGGYVAVGRTISDWGFFLDGSVFGGRDTISKDTSSIDYANSQLAVFLEIERYLGEMTSISLLVGQTDYLTSVQIGGVDYKSETPMIWSGGLRISQYFSRMTNDPNPDWLKSNFFVSIEVLTAPRAQSSPVISGRQLDINIPPSTFINALVGLLW
ncbi:MAG: hypothetical protein ABL958_13265 [Bdellovibrionia bacterium]